jgi:hypothetical protein
MRSRSQEVIASLVVSTRVQHPAFAELLHRARPENERVCPDGSIWFELLYDTQVTSLTDSERFLLTGTHPGLPFEVWVEEEEYPYLGLILFSCKNLLPMLVEVVRGATDQ